MPTEPTPAEQPAEPMPAEPARSRPSPSASPAEPPLTGASWRTDLFDIPEYLRMIGMVEVADGNRPEPSVELLSALHEAHVRALPFANVDALMGTHPGVAPDAVQDQLVRRGRGGYCFEHAQIFAAAAEHLGFPVRRALGRVHSPTNTRTHMTVLAEAGGRRWMCDPGFGYSLLRPLALEDGATQDLGGRTARLALLDDDGAPVWELSRDGAVEHRTDELPVKPADVRAGHFVTSREPHSPFVNHLMVMRHMPYGHVTITEGARTVRTAGRPTEHAQISVDQAVDGVRELGVRLGEEDRERLAARLDALRRGGAA
ncbi:arylamine N-acetyltransferase family protein [Tomitella fengzijianii]|uniref:Arylamine N-acetyltransferase n=1 Tax=Tomitella fengzijianii TaxID=2597660 RepID=A0A516WZ81_9ACTN|nr:arylamine N-acetyltransferase [Tomitella fengzijianii]QDQ96142.1 arylamine N-acetyltransferase [Tomitella fengzijianii]